jgi:hypothetical protein
VILRAGVAGSATTVAWLVSRPSARWHLYARTRSRGNP